MPCKFVRSLSIILGKLKPLQLGATFCAILGSVAQVMAAQPSKIDCMPRVIPELKLSWVSPDIIYNGLPMQTSRFESSEKPQVILARYRSEWKATALSPQDPIEYPVGSWQVIAKLIGRCFYTVQVRSDSGGSIGLLAVSQIQDASEVRVLGKDFPMMSGSVVATDMTHRDPGKTARTIVLKNQFSTDANADFYRRTIGADGWKLLSDHLVPYQGGNGHSYAMTFKRGINETSIVISRNQKGTSILANLVDNP